MNIARNTVVTLDYRVTDPDGAIVDDGSAPLTYLHGGYNDIFSKVEEALDGKAAGAAVRVNLLPEDAFGLYEDELVLTEDRADFPDKIEIGMQFELMNAENDEETLYTVTAVDDDKVVLDGNHPLAGMPLVFHCTVSNVRAATPAEIKQRKVLAGR
jgi:FKBP-type peptidyl-prolyl cis-trans isomerase SlyD